MAQTYIITGTWTFSSQANRDAAVARVNSVLSGQAVANRATAFPGGVNNSGTTVMTISIELPDDPSAADSLFNSMYANLVSTNRPASGYLTVSRV